MEKLDSFEVEDVYNEGYNNKYYPTFSALLFGNTMTGNVTRYGKDSSKATLIIQVGNDVFIDTE